MGSRCSRLRRGAQRDDRISRWAAGDNDRFPALAADLVRSKVTIIVAAGGNPSALAAKAVTSEIPIVFQVGADPVALGFVASLDRPGGNLTGVTSSNVEVGPKRLEPLHEVVPTATILGLLVNPKNAASETLSKEAQVKARALGLELHVLTASVGDDFDAAFGRFVHLGVGGVLIGNDPFFSLHSWPGYPFVMRCHRSRQGVSMRRWAGS